MRVEVYLEGDSDVYAMKSLLAPLVESKRKEGVNIKFFRARKGDAKAYLMALAPMDAALTLPHDPDVVMVVVPDLYPKDKPERHETPEELRDLALGNFRKALQNRGGKPSPELERRFQVFCFKHDLEVLLLAAKDQLAARLGVKSLRPSWTLPPENQNHGKPPKHVVQELFLKHRKASYQETTEAPLILGRADYRELTRVCDQCFRPFVEFLQSCGQA